MADNQPADNPRRRLRDQLRDRMHQDKTKGVGMGPITWWIIKTLVTQALWALVMWFLAMPERVSKMFRRKT